MSRMLITFFLSLFLSPAVQAGELCKPQIYGSVAVLNGWGDAPVVVPVTVGGSCMKRIGDSPWLVRGLAGGGASFTPAGLFSLTQVGGLLGLRTGPVIIWTGYVHNALITSAGLKHVPTGTIALAKPLPGGRVILTGNVLLNTVGRGIGGGLVYQL